MSSNTETVKPNTILTDRLHVHCAVCGKILGEWVTSGPIFDSAGERILCISLKIRGKRRRVYHISGIATVVCDSCGHEAVLTTRLPPLPEALKN